MATRINLTFAFHPQATEFCPCFAMWWVVAEVKMVVSVVVPKKKTQESFRYNLGL